MKTTADDVRRKLGRLREAGCDVDVNRNGAGWRFTTVNGDRDLSPRIVKNCDALLWLNGFEQGVENAKLAKAPGGSAVCGV